MPYLTCRACGAHNETSSRSCGNCGASEAELRAATDLGPWWPLLGIFAVLGVLYALARAGGTAPVLIWLLFASATCLSVGTYGVRRGSLALLGHGPLGATARLQGSVLVALGFAALGIAIVRLTRGA